MPLAPDDPAREKIKELRDSNASKEEIMDAMDTYEVSGSCFLKALSQGHAKLLFETLLEHMVEVHTDPGTAVVSSVKEPVLIEWLDGPLFGGDMND